MGAHHSNQPRNNEWMDHFKEKMPSFKGHEIDYLGMVLALIFLFYCIRQFVRKMFGTTRVTFAFHHKINAGEEIRVVGNASKLGNWDPNRAAPMKLMNKHSHDPVWVGHLDLNFPLRQPLEYKYVVMNCATWNQAPRMKEWEPCANRVLRHNTGRDENALTLHQSWGGRENFSHDKIPDYGDIAGCINPLAHPLIGA